MLKPEFEGVGTGRYSKADQLLKVHVAMPELVPEDPEGYLLDAVRAAIDAADAWAQRRGLGSDLGVLRAIADRA